MTTQSMLDLADHAASWPEEDQRELAEYARAIEARRNGLYATTPNEREAIVEGVDQADRGSFASEAELVEFRSQYRK